MEQKKVNFAVKTVYILTVLILLPYLVIASKLSLNLLALYTIIGTIFCAWLLSLGFSRVSDYFPCLLVQLLTGIIAKNFVVTKFPLERNSTLIFENSYDGISTMFRDFAMAVLVTKAGLSFDVSALKKVAKVCIALTILPCLTEILVCTLLAPSILGWFGLGLSKFETCLFGTILGCVLGAVTPAVIVPAMEDLKSRGFFEKSKKNVEISNLVIASSSFDDILAISFFTVLLGVLIESGESWVWVVSKGPICVLGGIFIGWILGKVLNNAVVSSKSFAIVVGITFSLVFNQLTIVLEVPAAGPLGCIVFGLVCKLENEKCEARLGKSLDVLWYVLEPAMFCLIGAEIQLEYLGMKTLAQAIALLFICLVFRTCVAYLIAYTSKQFSKSESLFISFAWLPKATVQAAIGTTALVRFTEQNSPQAFLQPSRDILTMAVLSILITAPLGSILIRSTANKLLNKNDETENKSLKSLD